MTEPVEQDVFARAGITDADFEDEGMDAPVLDEAPVEAAAEPPAEEGPNRDEHGRFAAKPVEEPQEPADAPQEAAQEPAKAEPVPEVGLNLSPAERALWGAADPSLRAAVSRRVGELESGLNQYRQRYEPLRQHMEMAERQGVSLPDVLNGYISAENMIRRDPAAGFEHICQGLGISFRDVAAKALGQPAPERDAVIDGLRQELHALKSQVSTVSQTFEQQRQSQITDFVTKFAGSHPRFDELSGDIAAMLKTGFATSLEDAYDKAERLKPAPAPAPVVAQEQVPPPQPRKPAANLSVSGAPSPGSNPAQRTPPPDRRDSIEWALQQVGI